MYSDVDIVKSRTNIVDIVGEYVKLTKAGSSFKACCPFHQEKTPSFIVNEDRQTYHCFGCGQGGDVLSFVMEMEGVGFREALTLLAEKAGVELQKNFSRGDDHGQDDRKKALYDIVDLSTRFYEKQLWEGSGGKDILAYVRNRGIGDATIKKFQLGFAPDGWHFLEKFLEDKGFEKDAIVQTGMLIKKDSGEYYDRFRGRIMFPIADVMGRVIGFTARALPGQDAQAKYINTPESLLYHKSSVLYGIHHAKQAIKSQDSVVIVEGNMDVVAAHDAGVSNVIAVSGTAMTDEHIRLLKRYTKNLILFFDSDKAGIQAARRSAIACYAADVQLRMVLLKEGKDAADIVREDPQKLQKIINDAENAVTVFIRMAQDTFVIEDPHGKRQAIEYVAEIIAHIANDIEKNEWIGKCAQIFAVSEQMIHKAMQVFVKSPEKLPYVQEDRSVGSDDDMDDEIRMQMQRIYRSIILMMMAYPHVWEHIYKNRDRYGPIITQSQIAALIREGPECGFSIGDFVSKDIRREALYKAAMKMQQLYETEREDGGSPIKDTETYIAIALENINQKKIDHLLKKMTEAERNGDSSTQKKILAQINTLSQQIIRNI
jgi:DNA primase